jgi:sugar lactone lactonase YvrE
MTPELALDARAELGEGPIWDDRRRRLLFVDIMRGHVHEFDPAANADRVLEVGEPVGAVALSTRGDWVVATGSGFSRLNPDTGAVAPIVAVEADRRGTRMNDGNVDSRGRFWAGTMSLEGKPQQGSLYRLDPDGSVTRMLSNVTTSNGIDWSPDDRTMYYVDTGSPRIDRFDFDAGAGTIGNRRPFVTIDPAAGKPDGLVVDADGSIWLALWKGGAVHKYSPGGRLELRVTLPVSLTTKPAFGGESLEDLYVTSAWIDLDADGRAAQPAAGGVFRLRPGARGRAPHRFAG